MTLALLCSGQGTQHCDMFRLTADAPAAAPVFEAARPRLGGRDPRKLAAAADPPTLHANPVAQILCCTQGLAAFRALQPHLPATLTFAGYSVGAWAAWGCAGALGLDVLFELVQRRAQLMDAAAGPDGGLAAVRGLRRAAVDALCARHAAAVAIVNPGDLLIVGGARHDLRALCDEAARQGAARASLLDVMTPSHTPRLAAAVAPLQAALEASRPLPPRAGVRLLSGHDGRRVRGVPADRAALAAQVATVVDWAATLQACDESGVRTVLELGPGTALAAMARDAIAGCDARGLDEFRTLEGAVAWLVGRARA